MKRLLILILILLPYVPAVHGTRPEPEPPPPLRLDPAKKTTQLDVRQWTADHGLPSGNILALCRTNDGYLWFSGYEGLVRFDGVRFRHFNSGNTPAMKNNTVGRMALDNHGRLWLGTQGSGLLMYDGEGFHAPLPHGQGGKIVEALFIDSNGAIWMGTRDKGVFRYKDGSLESYDKRFGIVNVPVQAITQARDGALWFATHGKGLIRFKDGTVRRYTSEKDGLINNTLLSLMADHDGTLWVGSHDGLCTYDGKDFQRVRGTERRMVYALARDHAGTLWIGTANDLFRLRKNHGKIEPFTTETEGFHFDAQTLLTDHEGSLWVGCFRNGVFRIRNPKTLNYTQREGLKGKIVMALCQDGDNGVLVGMDNGAVHLVNGGEVSLFPGLEDTLLPHLIHILKDSAGNLWISTFKGLMKISPDGKQRFHCKNTGFPVDRVRLTYEGKNGRIYVGTNMNGLLCIEKDWRPGDPIEHFDKSNGLGDNLIMSIGADAPGNLLVGTAGSGLNILDKEGGIRIFDIQKGMMDNIVFNTYTDGDGVVWMAVVGGLACLKGGKLINFPGKEGFPADKVLDVLDDNHGRLWMMTPSGILSIAKNALLLFANDKSRPLPYRFYDRGDGMKNSNCPAISRALRAPGGVLWFPTNDGVAVFDPGNIPTNTLEPPVHIEGLTVDKKNITLVSAQARGALDLEPGGRRFVFDYTALSYYEPSRVRFKYRLRGFESKWMDAGANRRATFTNLSNGHYTFEVIACNNDGVWNTKGAAVSFYIKPFFYQTTWFFLLVTLGALMTVMAVYRLRVARLKRRQAELEHTVEQRTAEIRQQNTELARQKEKIESQALSLESTNKKLRQLDRFKQDMTSMIVHDLKNPLNVILNVEMTGDAGVRLKMLKQTGRQMLNLVMNILDVHKYEAVKMTVEKTLHRFEEIAGDAAGQVAGLAERKGIILNRDMPREIYVEVEKELATRVLVNLLTNAVKFSPPGGTVSLAAGMPEGPGGGEIMVEVTDSGPGVPREQIERIFQPYGQVDARKSGLTGSTGIGLAFCKMAVEAHGGRIGLECGSGKGSKFWFMLPGAVCRDEAPAPETSVTGQPSPPTFRLSGEDRALVAPYAERLRELKVYKVTAIRRILKEIDRGNHNIEEWKDRINQAIGTGDQEAFSSLLEQ